MHLILKICLEDLLGCRIYTWICDLCNLVYWVWCQYRPNPDSTYPAIWSHSQMNSHIYPESLFLLNKGQAIFVYLTAVSETDLFRFFWGPPNGNKWHICIHLLLGLSALSDVQWGFLITQLMLCSNYFSHITMNECALWSQSIVSAVVIFGVLDVWLSFILQHWKVFCTVIEEFIIF